MASLASPLRPATRALVSNDAPFDCGKYTTRWGAPLTMKFHCWNLPIAIGESSKSSTDEAANVLGSLVGSSPDPMSQYFGMSSVTRARSDVAPTTYMSECRSPTSPPVSDRKGFHADRI